MGITSSTAKETTVVELRGSVDISQAADLKTLLCDAIASSPSVTIEAGEVSEMDITSIQLLWAAQRRARAEGKTFRIGGSWNPALETGLRESGLCPARIFGNGV